MGVLRGDWAHGGLLLLWRFEYWLDITPMYFLLAAHHTAAVSYQRIIKRKKRCQVDGMFSRDVSHQIHDFGPAS